MRYDMRLPLPRSFSYKFHWFVFASACASAKQYAMWHLLYGVCVSCIK